MTDFLSGRMPEQEDRMITMPAIDMVATGRNISKMRQAAGLTVKDLQILFGFATPLIQTGICIMA